MLGMLGIIGTLAGAIAILGACYLFSNRTRPADKKPELYPEDRRSLMEESVLGINKLDFAQWQVFNNKDDHLWIRLVDTVDGKEISTTRVSTIANGERLSVSAIERGIQNAMKNLADKEIAKRNRAAAISDLVSKYDGKEA